MKEPNNLGELYDRLCNFDWYYSWSDDPRVYLAGDKREKELVLAASRFGPEGQKLFAAMKMHHFTGESWGNEKQPKPKRPE